VGTFTLQGLGIAKRRILLGARGLLIWILSDVPQPSTMRSKCRAIRQGFGELEMENFAIFFFVSERISNAPPSRALA